MGTRHADCPKTEGDEGAIGGIDQHLTQEVAGEPRRRVIHGGGGALHVGGAHQADQPVAQILALQQDENDEQDDDAGGGERRQHRAKHALQNLEGPRLGLSDLDGDGLVGSRLFKARRRGGALWHRPCPLGDLVLDALERARDIVEGAGRFRRFAQGRDLACKHVLIARQVARKLRDLVREHPAKSEDDGEGQRHDNAYRRQAWHFDRAQQQQERRQHETQENGKRKRQQHLAPDIEPADDDGPDHQALEQGRAAVRARAEHRKGRARRHGGAPSRQVARSSKRGPAGAWLLSQRHSIAARAGP